MAATSTPVRLLLLSSCFRLCPAACDLDSEKISWSSHSYSLSLLSLRRLQCSRCSQLSKSQSRSYRFVRFVQELENRSLLVFYWSKRAPKKSFRNCRILVSMLSLGTMGSSSLLLRIDASGPASNQHMHVRRVHHKRRSSCTSASFHSTWKRASLCSR